ncbi:MAG TPA: carboxypeptidase-like regulatory domain-containing protein [Pyrinomonadaceae bacterium]|nr:carboxypeptidase-like regulatory domain-containing protein [Pyrinomonadaceae bacterium]
MKNSLIALLVVMAMVTTASAIYVVSRNRNYGGAAKAATPVRRPDNLRPSGAHSPERNAGSLSPGAQQERACCASDAVKSIKGRVLDSEGVAVSGATVFAEKEGEFSGALPSGTTDEQGNFLIGGLAPGAYKVYAEKEEDGYPSPVLSFYSGGVDSVARVTINEGEILPDVLLQLPPPSAILTGHITDITMNKPIEGAQITLRRADNPDQFLTTAPNVSGNFRIVVPTVPFTMEVSAPGHKTRRLGPLHLKQSEKKEMPVQLDASK